MQLSEKCVKIIRNEKKNKQIQLFSSEHIIITHCNIIIMRALVDRDGSNEIYFS